MSYYDEEWLGCFYRPMRAVLVSLARDSCCKRTHEAVVEYSSHRLFEYDLRNVFT